MNKEKNDSEKIKAEVNQDYWQGVHDSFKHVWDMYYYAEKKLVCNTEATSKISDLLEEILSIIRNA